MPTPLRRSETLLQHPSHAPLTHAEYLVALELLVPGCDPHKLDIHLTAFYEQFKLELSTRTRLDNMDYDHLAIIQIRRPSGRGPSDTVSQPELLAPAWMIDPDERRDKLEHFKWYNLYVIIPADDSCWARACRSAKGQSLNTYLSDIRKNQKPTTIRPEIDTKPFREIF